MLSTDKYLLQFGPDFEVGFLITDEQIITNSDPKILWLLYSLALTGILVLRFIPQFQIYLASYLHLYRR